MLDNGIEPAVYFVAVLLGGKEDNRALLFDDGAEPIRAANCPHAELQRDRRLARRTIAGQHRDRCAGDSGGYEPAALLGCLTSPGRSVDEFKRGFNLA